MGRNLNACIKVNSIVAVANMNAVSDFISLFHFPFYQIKQKREEKKTHFYVRFSIDVWFLFCYAMVMKTEIKLLNYRKQDAFWRTKNM